MKFKNCIITILILVPFLACDKQVHKDEQHSMTKVLIETFQNGDKQKLSEFLADEVYFTLVEGDNIYSKPQSGWSNSPILSYLLDTKEFRKSFNLDEITKETGNLGNASAIGEVFNRNSNNIGECYPGSGCTQTKFNISGRIYDAGFLWIEEKDLKYYITMYCFSKVDCRILRITVDYK